MPGGAKQRSFVPGWGDERLQTTGSKCSVVSSSFTPSDYLPYLLIWSPDILTLTLLQPPRTEAHQLFHLFPVSPTTPVLPSQDILPSTFLTTSLLAPSLLPPRFSLACLANPCRWVAGQNCTPAHDSKSRVDHYK